jgi:hypothetical protein
MAGRALAKPAQPEETGREDMEGTPAALHELVRRRAHEIYLKHGGHGQSEIDDWLQAEIEILHAQGKVG